MKSTILIFLFTFLFSFSSQAQTDQGTLMLGGSGSFTHEMGIGLTLLPTLGYFVADNLALGAGMEFRYHNTDINRSWSIGVQPFMRYYFGENSQTRIFGELSGGITRMRQYIMFFDPNFPEYDMDVIYKNNHFGAGVGVVHFITDNVGLEVQAAYHSTQIGIAPRRNRFGLHFGVQVYLPRQ